MKKPISLDDLETLEAKIINSICPEYHGNLGSLSEVYLCTHILKNTFRFIIEYIKENLQIEDQPVIYFMHDNLYFKVFIKNNILNFKRKEEVNTKIEQLSEHIIDKLGINSTRYYFQPTSGEKYFELTFVINDDRFKILLQKVEQQLKDKILNMTPLTNNMEMWKQAQQAVIEEDL